MPTSVLEQKYCRMAGICTNGTKIDEQNFDKKAGHFRLKRRLKLLLSIVDLHNIHWFETNSCFQQRNNLGQLSVILRYNAISIISSQCAYVVSLV